MLTQYAIYKNKHTVFTIQNMLTSIYYTKMLTQYALHENLT